MKAIEHRQIISLLHASGCSCVIASGSDVLQCHRRGVADLLSLLRTKPGVLLGAFVADKVVGKGAAALMILGGVASVYADVVSLPALRLLDQAGIPVEYATCTDNIINRAGTDICPVESLCRDCATAAECLPLIEDFIDKTINK